MILSEAMREEIKADIAQCEAHIDITGSEALYGVLIAKYSVIDSDFANGLSTNGKATTIGKEYDYRQELKTIAAKLKMWLLASPTQNSSNTVSLPNTPNSKVEEFIRRGEEIKKNEYHPAQGGFPISYVSGPKFDTWMGEINIFNERYLKRHPLHNSIHSTYFHYRKNPSSCDDMLGHLRALASDVLFLSCISAEMNYPTSQRVKTVAQLLSEDILRCQQYLYSQENESLGRNLYIEITGDITVL